MKTEDNWIDLNDLQAVAIAQSEDQKPKRKSSPRKSLEQRFWEKVTKPVDNKACWNWTGATGGKTGYDGYGQLFTGEPNTKNKVLAHRYSYWLHYGDFDQDLFVCHTCDNPRCVNPDHLFIGTNKDNMQDASSKGRLANRRHYLAEKTHCCRGHEFTVENTIVNKHGHRWCRKCQIIRAAKRGRKGAIARVKVDGLI